MITKRNLPELFVLILILLFILLKLSALQLPYFWDELGVYARAGLYMHDNGMGLMPKDLPPELSRGHPLLFSFIQAIGYSVFGDTVVGGHATALTISVVLLCSLYFITAKHYSKYTGLLAVMLLITQPLFFAQSVLILPEICLALFMIWSIHFWVVKKYLLHGIFAALAILIKETAIIIPFVIVFSELALYVAADKKIRKNKFDPRFLFAGFSLVVFAAFLLIQKEQNGWYLFPLHGDNIAFDWDRIWLFGRDYTTFLFIEQGRIIMSLAMCFLYVYVRRSPHIKTNRMSVFLILLICGGLSFNAINFYMNRYILFVLLPFVILFSALMIQVYTKFRFAILALPVLFVASVYCMNGRELIPNANSGSNLQQKFTYDENMGYVPYILLQQEAMNWVLDKTKPADIIYSNFPVSVALQDTRFGFTDKVLNKDFRERNANNFSEGFRFAVISDPGSYDYHLPATDSIDLVKIIKNEVSKVNIYTSR